jgi:hypothetical protein
MEELFKSPAEQPMATCIKTTLLQLFIKALASVLFDPFFSAAGSQSAGKIATVSCMELALCRQGPT